jgi:heptosyltransferase I
MISSPAHLHRLLIVKLSSIGDVVQALPVASALRRRYPAMRISWAVEDWTAPLVQGHPAVDRLLVFPAMRWTAAGAGWTAAFARAVRELREEEYDVVLDLQGLFKSALIALISRAPVRLGVRPQREGSWLISHAVPASGGRRHAVDSYLSCAEWLGAPAEPVSFGLAAQPGAIASIRQQLSAIGVVPRSAVVVINPTSSASRKNWGINCWAAVAGALAEHATILLVGERGQRARHAEIVCRAGRCVHDLTGRTSLAELIALLDQCSLHIGPDTGSVHVAAALGRPVIAVYGPTAPWRLAPYGQEDAVIHHRDRCGRGCPRWCRLRRACLRAATAEEVIHRARGVLGNCEGRATVCG